MGALTVFFLIVAVASQSTGKLSDSDSYNVYLQLEKALINGETSLIPNLKVLERAFFPMRSGEPVCVPVQYSLICSGNSSNSSTLLGNTVHDEQYESEVTKLNLTYLWTEYYVSHTTGTLLFAFSQRGITLRGFEWEKSCDFMNTVPIILELDSENITCLSAVVDEALGDLTSQLKAYVDAKGIPKATSDYRGYALKWNNSDETLSRYNIVFIVYVVIIDVFIVCSSLSFFVLYQRLYNNIKGKRNPGYSLFWAIVLLSIFWNVAPSWLVLSKIDYKMYSSLAILIPVQLITALLVKKKSDFPIPMIKSVKPDHDADIHSLDKAVLADIKTFCSHAIQVLSIWSLLITFTFVMHYVTSIILSLYIDPLGALVKIVFVKAVIVSFIINLALLFAVDVITLKARSFADCKKNLVSVVWILTAASLFLVLIFLFFLLVGVVFNYSTRTNSLSGVFAIVPSATLLFASFLGRGVLFPQGLKDKGNPEKEVMDDLEGSSPPPLAPPDNNNGDTRISMTETSPLLTHSKKYSEEDGEGVHARATASVNSSTTKPV